MNNDKTHASQPGKSPTQDVIQGKWRQIKGKVQEKWGDLTDDDLQAAEGNREYLVGKIQERYGRTRDQAEQEVRDFERNLDQSSLDQNRQL